MAAEEDVSHIVIGSTDEASETGTNDVDEPDGDLNKLTLGTISQEIQTLGKRQLPTILTGRNRSMRRRIDLFLSSVVQYAAKIHPTYWKFLVDSKYADKFKGPVDVKPEEFPLLNSKIKFEKNKATIEVTELNWYAIWNTMSEEWKKIATPKEMDKLKNGPKKIVQSLAHFMQQGSHENDSKSRFGRIICGLLVKLYDSRAVELRPRMCARQLVLSDEIIANYKTLNGRKWSKRLALEDKEQTTFPGALNEVNDIDNLEMDVDTDNEENENLETFAQLHTALPSKMPALSLEHSSSTKETLNKLVNENKAHQKELDQHRTKVLQLEETIGRKEASIEKLRARCLEEDSGNQALDEITEKIPRDKLIPVLNHTAKLVVGLFEKKQELFADLEMDEFIEKVISSVSRQQEPFGPVLPLEPTPNVGENIQQEAEHDISGEYSQPGEIGTKPGELEKSQTEVLAVNPIEIYSRADQDSATKTDVGQLEGIELVALKEVEEELQAAVNSIVQARSGDEYGSTTNGGSQLGGGENFNPLIDGVVTVDQVVDAERNMPSGMSLEVPIGDGIVKNSAGLKRKKPIQLSDDDSDEFEGEDDFNYSKLTGQKLPPAKYSQGIPISMMSCISPPDGISAGEYQLLTSKVPPTPGKSEKRTQQHNQDKPTSQKGTTLTPRKKITGAKEAILESLEKVKRTRSRKD